MARRKPRKRQKNKKPSHIAWGGSAARGTSRWNIALGVGAIALIAGGAWWWWQARQTETTFLALAAQGQEGLSAVQVLPNEGRTHLQPGTAHQYSTAVPTSGAHVTVWTNPGFYREVQTPTLLVHALEHGNVVVYYDRADPDTLDMLKDWTSIYSGQWDGVIVTPSPGLGKGIVLTAWRRKLELDRFEPALAAAFVDAFRGRGPEHAVR